MQLTSLDLKKNIYIYILYNTENNNIKLCQTPFNQIDVHLQFLNYTNYKYFMESLEIYLLPICFNYKKKYVC